MDFLSRIQFESKVIPGAVVTFKRVTATTRATFTQALAKYRVLLREIQRQRKPLDDAYNAAMKTAKASAKIEVDRLIEAENTTREEAEKRVPLQIDFPDNQFAEWADSLDRQRQVERDAMGLCGLRAQFVSITGYTIQGEIPNIETLIDEAADEFTAELVDAANGIAGLSPTERGESPWPGTSPRVVDGPKPSTIAESAVKETAAV